MIAKTEFHIQIKDGHSKPAALLAAESGLSVSQVKQAMQKGAVWISDAKGTRRLRRQGNPVKTGSELHLYFNETVLSQQPLEAELIADEQTYSIWFKPGGMLSQGSRWGDHTTIGRFVEASFDYQRPVFTVHRLDKATSGIMVLAHNKKMAKIFSTMFANRKVRKCYLALVEGKYSLPGSTRVDIKIDGRNAVSHVRLQHYFVDMDRSLLQVKIDTGRKHQIRRHLSELGYPVVGDRLYGNAGEDAEDLQLFSARLGFKCPLSGRFRVFVLPGQLIPQL